MTTKQQLVAALGGNTVPNLERAREIDGGNSIEIPLSHIEPNSRAYEKTAIERALAPLKKLGWKVQPGGWQVRRGDFNSYIVTAPSEQVDVRGLSVEHELRVDGNAPRRAGDVIEQLDTNAYPVRIDSRKLSAHHVNEASALLSQLARRNWVVNKTLLFGSDDFVAEVTPPNQPRLLNAEEINRFIAPAARRAPSLAEQIAAHDRSSK